MSPGAIIVTLVLGVLAVGLVMTERGGRDVRRLALIAALAAAATAGRVLFVAIPSVKPVTVIVLVTGAVLGARAGFAVGALTPLLVQHRLGPRVVDARADGAVGGGWRGRRGAPRRLPHGTPGWRSSDSRGAGCSGGAWTCGGSRRSAPRSAWTRSWRSRHERLVRRRARDRQRRVRARDRTRAGPLADPLPRPRRDHDRLGIRPAAGRRLGHR